MARDNRIRPVGVFDIETEGWDRFFCGAILHDGRVKTYRHHDERRMVEDLLAIGEGDVMAHNGGRFDFLWLIDALFKFKLIRDGMKIDAAESGSSIIAMTITGPGGMRLRFRDSFRMFPVSLRTMGSKGEVGVDCTMESPECREKARLQGVHGKPITGCGGYCAIKRGMDRAAERRVIEYCAQDCRALWDGVRRLIAFAEDELALSLAGTTGATAWKTAKTWELIEPTELQHRQWSWIREGYFGGRVGLFRSKADRGWHYDITSSYPYQTSQPLPDGIPAFKASPSEAGRAYRSCKPGVYRARVTVPECMIPPLPYRAMIGKNRRNAYPVGSFEGTWALPELLYAETIDCKVEPLAGMIFPGERDAFRPLMNHLIASRLRYGKSTAEGKLIKLWANSLYGKFAQEPRTHRLVLARSSFDVPENSIPINEEGTAFLVPYERTPPIPDCSHVEKAAYITARGRIQLHRMLTAQGEDDAIYCDTDSVFATRPRNAAHGVRDGLGGWADEGEFRDFSAIAPKLYRYDQKEADGSLRPVMRAKGIALPKDIDALEAVRAWRELEKGSAILNETGVNSIRTALRSGGPLFKRRALARSTSGKVTYGDRVPHGDRSLPPRAEDLTPVAREYSFT